MLMYANVIKVSHYIFFVEIFFPWKPVPYPFKWGMTCLSIVNACWENQLILKVVNFDSFLMWQEWVLIKLNLLISYEMIEQVFHQFCAVRQFNSHPFALLKTNFSTNGAPPSSVCKLSHFHFSAQRLFLFKLVDTRSVETSFLRWLRYANVSLTHSGVDTVRN